VSIVMLAARHAHHHHHPDHHVHDVADGAAAAEAPSPSSARSARRRHRSRNTRIVAPAPAAGGAPSPRGSSTSPRSAAYTLLAPLPAPPRAVSSALSPSAREAAAREAAAREAAAPDGGCGGAGLGFDSASLRTTVVSSPAAALSEPHGWQRLAEEAEEKADLEAGEEASGGGAVREAPPTLLPATTTIERSPTLHALVELADEPTTHSDASSADDARVRAPGSHSPRTPPRCIIDCTPLLTDGAALSVVCCCRRGRVASQQARGSVVRRRGSPRFMRCTSAWYSWAYGRRIGMR
jgi:hypothetical protein